MHQAIDPAQVNEYPEFNRAADLAQNDLALFELLQALLALFIFGSQGR